MKQKLTRFIQTNSAVIVAALLFYILLLIPTGYEGALTYQGADRVRAKVLTTDESNIVDTGLIRTGDQRCTVKLLNGRFKGQTVTATNRLSGSLAQDKIFSPGDMSFVAVSYNNDTILVVDRKSVV